MTAETEQRIAEQLATVTVQLATIGEQLKHFATKEELQKLRVEMILWLIGTNIAVGGAIIWWVNGRFDQLTFMLQHWKP